MKKILIVSFAVCFVGFIIIVNRISTITFEKRVERMNAHIKYLHNEEGYTWEAARKIGLTEAGFIPQDSEYKSLKED
jgi:hypothetical protein